MKIVPFSNTLLVDAKTNSNTTGVTHCIISFDETELRALKEYCKMADTMKALDSDKFYCIERWFESDIWIDNEEIDLQDKVFAFIEITQEEIDALPDLDLRLTEGVIKIMENNITQFSCFDENDRSEYWSLEFSITELLNQ